jgi:TonB-dependent receptor
MKPMLDSRFLSAQVSMAALALGLLSVPGTARAQTTPQQSPPAAGADPSQPDESTEDDSVEAAAEAPEDEVVVTGLRASLESAQEIKRNAEQFVDSINAQDIGRLPDTNVAEALQRISGVQITRTYGEGNGIAVRGLTQVRTELNGRDVFSASGGRGLSWEEVGSDLLAGVDVYKNPSAELVEGGLSGTVNLRTRLPFDSKERVIAATVGSTYYDLIEEGGQQASGLYSNRWNTGIGEFGILANVSWQTTAFREDKLVVEPFYQHGPTAPGVLGPIPGFENQVVLAPHGGGFAVGYGNRERLSIATAAQWRPTPGLEFYAQYFRADYDFLDAGTSFFASGADMPPAAGQPFSVDEGGVARTGFFRNPNNNSVVFSNARDTSTTDISGGMKWDITRRLKLNVDYQHIDSDVQQKGINLTIGAGNPRTSLAGLGQNYDFFYDITGEIPVFRPTVPGYYANPANYGLTAILPYAEDNEAKADAIRADLSWDFDSESPLRQIRVGGRFTDKSAINRNTTYGTWTAIGSTCANWSSAAACYTLAEVPQIAELNQFQADLLRGRGAGAFGPVYQWRTSDALNPDAAFATVRDISGQVITYRPFDNANPPAFNGTIAEKTYAAYVRAAFAFDLFGMRIDGNTGVRVVRTETEGNGFQVLSYRQPGVEPTPGPNGQPVAPPTLTFREPFTGQQEYTKYLPSVNVRAYLTDQFLFRFAFSKNFARPSFTQLNPSFSIGPTYTGQTSQPDLLTPNQPAGPNNPFVGTGSVAGNPNLKPEEVTQFDAALEWYFSRSGYVYGTAFRKNIRNLIETRPIFQTRDIPDLGPVRFNVATLINVSKGYAQGFELGGQKFFDFLPAPFDGLGIQANYTYVDSDAGLLAAGDINSASQIKVPLVGLSKNSYNLIGLYSKAGLDIRVAYNWRDDYLQGTNNTGTQNLPIFGAPRGYLDASISLDVTKNFSITVDGQNLLDTPFKTYQIFDDRPRDYGINDRRFSIRARVRY